MSVIPTVHTGNKDEAPTLVTWQGRGRAGRTLTTMSIHLHLTGRQTEARPGEGRSVTIRAPRWHPALPQAYSEIYLLELLES